MIRNVFLAAVLITVCGCKSSHQRVALQQLETFREKLSDTDSVTIQLADRDTTLRLDQYHHQLLVKEFEKVGFVDITQRPVGRLVLLKNGSEISSIALLSGSSGFQLTSGAATFNYSMTYRLGMFLSEMSYSIRKH